LQSTDRFQYNWISPTARDCLIFTNKSDQVNLQQLIEIITFDQYFQTDQLELNTIIQKAIQQDFTIY
jgi:hypothetical protein